MKIRLKHYSFDLASPYSAGHQLTPSEAQALNALRAENIRNNFAKRIERATATLLPGESLSPQALAELQSALGAYDRSYQFGLKHEPRLRLSALEAEIKTVASEKVEAQARQVGRELSSSELEALVAEMASVPGVQDEARRRLAERSRVVAGALEELL